MPSCQLLPMGAQKEALGSQLLSVTAIVFHGNRSKAAEVSWVLASFLAYVCSFQVLVGPDFLRGFAGP